MRFETNTARNVRGAARSLALLVGLALGIVATDAAAQARRGPIAVLGLRSPDGDDSAADTMTAALREAARALGFEPAETVPSLDQALSMYSCDEQHIQDCLHQVAVEIRSARLIYGEARHRGDPSSPVQIVVSLYNAANQTHTDTATVEVARALAIDDDSLAPIARRLISQLIPPPPPGQVEVIPPPPDPPPPPPEPAQPPPPPEPEPAPRSRHHHHHSH